MKMLPIKVEVFFADNLFCFNATYEINFTTKNIVLSLFVLLISVLYLIFHIVKERFLFSKSELKNNGIIKQEQTTVCIFCFKKAKIDNY